MKENGFYAEKKHEVDDTSHKLSYIYYNIYNNIYIYIYILIYIYHVKEKTFKNLSYYLNVKTVLFSNDLIFHKCTVLVIFYSLIGPYPLILHRTRVMAIKKYSELPQNLSGASLLDCLVSYIGHSLAES